MTHGITARPAEMRLTERAADYLAAGPADVVALIGHICQLPNPPRIVAEHMAVALFAGRTEFARNESGHWELRPPRAGIADQHSSAATTGRPSPRGATGGRASLIAEPRGRAYAPPIGTPASRGTHSAASIAADSGESSPWDPADLLA